MYRVGLLLFAIPTISIVAIALLQIFDETFKKKFVLERRTATSADVTLAGAPRRRYGDAVLPGTLRNPATTASGKGIDVPEQKVIGV